MISFDGMILDALIIFLLQGTNFTYKEDCLEMFGKDIVAYHRAENNKSYINICKEGWKTEHIVHELGHEIHYRIRQEKEFEKLVNAFEKLNTISSKDSDYISEYARKNVNEDFAETFEKYYSLGKKIPEVEKSDWIGYGKSEILVVKFIVIEKIINKYSKISLK